jgi:hypothetical protein
MLRSYLSRLSVPNGEYQVPPSRRCNDGREEQQRVAGFASRFHRGRSLLAGKAPPAVHIPPVGRYCLERRRLHLSLLISAPDLQRVGKGAREPRSLARRRDFRQYDLCDARPCIAVRDKFHLLVGANHDRLYTFSILDLSKKPEVLHVSGMAGWYYSFQFIDSWWDLFAYVGQRTTGTQAGEFLVTGPGWKGEAPSGMAQISSLNNSVLVMGRVLVDNDIDVAAAYGLSKQIHLTPLSGRQPSPKRRLMETKKSHPKMVLCDFAIRKGSKDETIPENPLDAGRHCRHDGNNCFDKEYGKGQCNPNILFYYLDRCVYHPHRDHYLVLASKQAEIENTYEHDRSRESDEEIRGSHRRRQPDLSRGQGRSNRPAWAEWGRENHNHQNALLPDL